MKKLITQSEEETASLGDRVAARLEPGAVLTLQGDLGTGKTVLIRGICRSLKVRERVTSPTFIFMNEYHGEKGGDSLKIYHFDFYRINSIKEVEAFDLDDYFGKDNISVIEWPEKIAAYIPKECFRIRLNYVDAIETSRSIELDFEL